MSTPEESGPAHCIDVAAGLVVAEGHLFHLVDTAAPGQGDVKGLPPVPGRRLVTVGAGAVLATFNSEVEDNEPYVDLEYWSAEPPYGPGDDPWEVDARETLAVSAGRLTLTSGVSGFGAPHELTVPRGLYRLAVWCRGRAEARAARRDAIDAGTFPHGVEHWLVRLWPVPVL